MDKYYLDTPYGRIHIGHLDPESFHDWAPDKEEWRSVPLLGFENFLISSYGRCKNMGYGANKRSMTGEKDKNGYLKFLMRSGGNKTRHFSHRLVAMAFLGTEDLSLTVDHIDSNKLNNRVDNLQWMNAVDNCVKGTKTLMERRGKKGFSCLNPEDFEKIKELYLQGCSYKYICDELGLTVRPDSLGCVLKGRKYSRVSGITEDLIDDRYRMTQDKANVYYTAVLFYGMMQQDATKLVGFNRATTDKLLNNDKCLHYFENYIALLTEGS